MEVLKERAINDLQTRPFTEQAPYTEEPCLTDNYLTDT